MENVSGNFAIVPNSFSGYGTFLVSGQSAIIQTSQLSATLNRFSYQVQALKEGDFSVVDSSIVTYTDPATGLEASLVPTDEATVSVGVCGVNAPDEPVQVPEPITIVLFGSGLAGLAGYARSRRKA